MPYFHITIALITFSIAFTSWTGVASSWKAVTILARIISLALFSISMLIVWITMRVRIRFMCSFGLVSILVFVLFLLHFVAIGLSILTSPTVTYSLTATDTNFL